MYEMKARIAAFNELIKSLRIAVKHNKYDGIMLILVKKDGDSETVFVPNANISKREWLGTLLESMDVIRNHFADPD